MAFFFSFASFASSFANVLAYGLTQIAKDPEEGGWRWIFIIQGCITCALAVVAWFIVVDFPESKRNRFLTESENEALLSRLLSERGDAEAGKMTPKIVLEVVKMWHPWVLYVQTTQQS
jgi:MFS family permease